MSFWYNSPTVIHPANVPQTIRQACKIIASVQTPLCELYIRSVTRKTNVSQLLYIFFRARSAALLQTIKLFSSIVKNNNKKNKKETTPKQTKIIKWQKLHLLALKAASKSKSASINSHEIDINGKRYLHHGKKSKQMGNRDITTKSCQMYQANIIKFNNFKTHAV